MDWLGANPVDSSSQDSFGLRVRIDGLEDLGFRALIWGWTYYPSIYVGP